jgi:23S rRNA (adenine2503-C2)-methyltransferase
MDIWANIRVIKSANENVSKYVFEKDDAVAEAVLYKYPTYEDRTVICCSTQSGCPIGCRFCGAGDYFVRSLTSEEITSQPLKLIEDTGVEAARMAKLQIMFMSMGEPMLNQKALIPSLHKLHDMYPNASLLISSVAPEVSYSHILEAARTIQTVGLQFSVHESQDEKRNALIPFKKKLNLREIAKIGQLFFGITGRSPFLNYCVHEQNGTEEDAERLANIFNPAVWQATISVICERSEHVAAANQRQKQLAEDFQRKLWQRGFRTRVFDPAGQDDIGGGCGQLWFVQDWMKNHPEHSQKSVGFGLQVIHTPQE